MKREKRNVPQCCGKLLKIIILSRCFHGSLRIREIRRILRKPRTGGGLCIVCGWNTTRISFYFEFLVQKQAFRGGSRRWIPGSSMRFFSSVDTRISQAESLPRAVWCWHRLLTLCSRTKKLRPTHVRDPTSRKRKKNCLCTWMWRSILVENLFYYNPRPVPSPSTPSLRFVLKLTEILCIKVDSNSKFHLRRLTRDLAKGALKKHAPTKFWTFWRYSDQFLEILRSIFFVS